MTCRQQLNGAGWLLLSNEERDAQRLDGPEGKVIALGVQNVTEERLAKWDGFYALLIRWAAVIGMIACPLAVAAALDWI